MTTNWKLGLTFALTTAVMWGFLPLGLNVVLQKMDPITISWYRFSVSAVIALLWYGYRSGPALKKMLFTHHWPLALAATAGLSGNYILYILGLERTTPGAAQILIQIAPLLLLVCSVILFRERFSKLQWLGVFGFAMGMLLFFHPRLSSSVLTSEDYFAGVLFLLAASVVWTVYGLAQKQLLRDFHTRDILLLLCLAGTFALMPLARPEQVFLLDTTELWILLFCGINTIVAYGCFGLAMSYWQASRVSAIIPLAPLLTLLFTYLINATQLATMPAEPLDWLSGFGALLVVAGATLSALSGSMKAESTARHAAAGPQD